jgi:NifB/MoaA-like Fe-S oxidoreductase
LGNFNDCMICFKQNNMHEKNDQVHITQKFKIGLSNCYGHRILNYFHQMNLVFSKHTFNERVKARGERGGGLQLGQQLVHYSSYNIIS